MDSNRDEGDTGDKSRRWVLSEETRAFNAGGRSEKHLFGFQFKINKKFFLFYVLVFTRKRIIANCVPPRSSAVGLNSPPAAPCVKGLLPFH